MEYTGQSVARHSFHSFSDVAYVCHLVDVSCTFIKLFKFFNMMPPKDEF